MTTSSFRAEDWVYVADSMGRLGQGFYKNRRNPNQTISVRDFEAKRKTQVRRVPSQEEQIVNKKSAGRAQSTSTGQTGQLTPWDNPMVGEQTAGGSSASTPHQRQLPLATLREEHEAERKKQQEKAKQQERKRREDEEQRNRGREGDGNDRVICTELLRQGYMSLREHRISTIYTHNHLPDSFMTGYHFWAIPYVRLMRRSNLATQIVRPLAHHRNKEVIKRLGYSDEGSWFGALLLATHDRLCMALGNVVKAEDYRTLYDDDAPMLL